MKPKSKQWLDCSRACALLVCLTLAGCQPLGALITETAGSESTSTAIGTTKRAIQTPAGLILLAEAELAFGNADAALTLYLKASQQSMNTEVSERAAFLARQVGSDQQIEEALERWSLVDPQSRGALEASLFSRPKRVAWRFSKRRSRGYSRWNLNIALIGLQVFGLAYQWINKMTF